MTPSDASARPPRWLRTLPWLAGLLIGASAHIVWFTSVRAPAPRAVEVVEVPAVTVHVHPGPQAPVVRHVARGTAGPGRAPIMTTRLSPPEVEANGAVICRQGHCTLRRSFVRRMLHDPELLGRSTRVVPRYDGKQMRGLKIFGVFPGGLADLLGLVSGDTIVAVDGHALDSLDEVSARFWRLPQVDRFSLTLEHADVVRTMTYRIVDG